MKLDSTTACALIAVAAPAAIGQNTTMWIDSAASNWEWDASALGASAVPLINNDFDLYGPLYLDLGMNASGNVSSGQFIDSEISIFPDIQGFFPNPIPGAPNLVDFHIEHVELSAQSFPLDFGDPATSDGSFQGDSVYVFTSGIIHLTILGGFPYDIDLTGEATNSQVVFGQFTVQPNGTIHLDSFQSHNAVVTEPSTGITFTVDLWGDVVADSITTQQAICFGDGTGTTCPCGNFGGSGEGCMNGTLQGAVLSASGSTSVGDGDLVLNGSQLVPGQPGLYFQGNNAVNGGMGVTFGDGLRCAGGGVVRLQVRAADASGSSSTTIDVGVEGGVTAGGSKVYQLWYRDPQSSMCSTTFNLTNGMQIFWLP
ncbi:MAG: hypothetical protein QF903_07595 [Planctomycetota bacterium]|jgi:hypothetical protein|nr:hypothetical protein [Planctomycetota bacterium]MDP6761926.1 hypothetical protein [Planctomycetota bacterium]MDP6989329.1 hypothetical protein [Planctomycetota bacterium]